VGFDEQDMYVASCDALGMVYVLNVQTREVVHTLHGGDLPVGRALMLTAPAAMVEESRSWESAGLVGFRAERFLVTHTRGEVVVWRAESGEVYARQPVAGPGEDDAVVCVDCVRQGGWLQVCVATAGGRVVVWSLSASRPEESQVQELHDGLAGGIHRVVFSSSALKGDQRAVVAQGPTHVAVWVGADGASGESTFEDEVPSQQESGKSDPLTMYRPAFERQVAQSGFMQGGAAAQIVGYKVRVVVKGGWLLEYGMR
jgi:hypothetical protein